jgi:hypothetical protein
VTARDGHDAVDRLDAADQPIVLLLVFDLHRHEKIRADVAGRRNPRRMHRDVLVGDGRRDFRQQIRSIARDDAQIDGIGAVRALLVRPDDVDQARRPLRVLRRTVERIEDVANVGTVDPMHGHTGPPRHVADDLVARHGAATARHADQGVVEAFDLDRNLIFSFVFFGGRGDGRRVFREQLFRTQDIARCLGHVARLGDVIAEFALLRFRKRLDVGVAQARDDPSRGHPAVSDPRQQIVQRVQRVAFQNARHDVFLQELRRRQPDFLDFTLQELAAARDVFVAAFALEPIRDLVARRAALDDVQPVARRTAHLVRREDFDDVAVFQLIRQGHHAAVDFRAVHGVADVAVNVVRKIDRHGARRQRNHFAHRRKHEHFLGKKPFLQRVHVLGGVAHVVLPLEELAQPRQTNLKGVLFAVGGALLVAPVRGDAVFGRAVHRFRSNLNFERDAAVADDGRVQRLVACSNLGMAM